PSVEAPRGHSCEVQALGSRPVLKVEAVGATRPAERQAPATSRQVEEGGTRAAPEHPLDRLPEEARSRHPLSGDLQVRRRAPDVRETQRILLAGCRAGGEALRGYEKRIATIAPERPSTCGIRCVGGWKPPRAQTGSAPCEPLSCREAPSKPSLPTSRRKESSAPQRRLG